MRIACFILPFYSIRIFKQIILTVKSKIIERSSNFFQNKFQGQNIKKIFFYFILSKYRQSVQNNIIAIIFSDTISISKNLNGYEEEEENSNAIQEKKIFFNLGSYINNEGKSICF